MKRILVPTDFSDYALNAAKVAAQLAKKHNARIFFLHVVGIPQSETGIMPGQSGQDIGEGLFILKMIKKKFRELFQQDFLQGIQVAEAVQFNNVFDNISELSKKHQIDLIVMGTHGASGFINDYLIGSNTDKVVRLSEVPVLTVRDFVPSTDFKNIVFASDFQQSIMDSFYQIQPIIDTFDAKISLLRVVTRDDFYFTDPLLEIMDKFAKDNGLKNYTCHVVNAENVQEGINEFAARKEADLVATITNGRRGLARLFNGSVTSEVVKSSPLPILTVKAAKK
ncbi:MAG: universal stress protein [Crocinitomicaceae bacterium]|nr:universal stress protein [Crocinitomicaceae bacterium]